MKNVRHLINEVILTGRGDSSDGRVKGSDLLAMRIQFGYSDIQDARLILTASLKYSWPDVFFG